MRCRACRNTESRIHEPSTIFRVDNAGDSLYLAGEIKAGRVLTLANGQTDDRAAPQDNLAGVAMKAESILDSEYRPAEDEPFMNERQLEYFRNKLLAWKHSILEESRGTIEDMQEGTRNIPDVADRASEETDRALELRTRDRQRKVISKIDAALRRIEEGTYGFCDETGEPISLKRLDARPIATLSLEAQERHERKEKVHRDE
jgi:DnaK suppressor protein